MDKEFQIDNEHLLINKDGIWTLFTNGVERSGQPLFFYKYYSLDEFNIDALRNCYFYLSNPIKFNDPFDCCNNLIAEKQKDPIDGQPTPLINDNPHIGVSCFSTIDLNPLMWGHYTKSYTGFVVKYKLGSNLIKSQDIDSFLIRQIIYSSNPRPASEKFSFAENYQFLIKLKHWEYENEWRLIAKKGNKQVDKIYFNKNAVQEIMFGYKNSPYLTDGKTRENYYKLQELVLSEYKNVPFFKVGPHEKEFKLVKRRLYINPPIENIRIRLA